MHWPHIEIFLNQNLHRATFGEEDLLDLVLYKGRQKWTSINAFRNLFIQNHKNIFNHYNWHNVPFGKLDSYLLCPYPRGDKKSKIVKICFPFVNVVSIAMYRVNFNFTLQVASCVLRGSSFVKNDGHSPSNMKWWLHNEF